MKFAQIAGAILAAALGAYLAPCAQAQNPDTMMPEQSAAKAKQILRDLINGLGGPGYTDVHESECSGRRALFGHDGGLVGYINYNDFRHYPDKARIEYIGKGRNTILQSLIGIDDLDFAHGGIVITLFNGDRGWTYDRSGINEMPVTTITDFQGQMKRSVDNLLRFRLNEPGMVVRWGGHDTVDLRQVDWVELTDSEDRKFRLAVDQSTHYLVRSVVSTKDPEYNQIDEDSSIYTNYQLKDSVWTPMQITREHNGRRTAQFFVDNCHYNPGFPADLFQKDSLNKRGMELSSKKK